MQKVTVGHEIELKTPVVSTTVGLDQVEPSYVNAWPPKSTAAQNAAVGHDTALGTPVESMTVGADHAEPS
jgi:hypothetical protein